MAYHAEGANLRSCRISKLKERWEQQVQEKLIHYNGDLLQTRVLDPGDERFSFFLIFNEGRRRYIKQLASRNGAGECPFCSSTYGRLKLDNLASIRLLPNTFPCLPYQFVLSPEEHASSLEIRYLNDAMQFALDTGLKVYCNAPGAGGAYTHVVFQASEKHCSAPSKDFFLTLRPEQFAEKESVRAEHFDHGIFGVKLTGDRLASVATIVSRLVQDSIIPMNLLFKDNKAFLIPRNNVEIPTGFGRWKFGVLEAIGIFICQDEKTYKTLTYEDLEKARAEISLDDEEIRTKLIDDVTQLIYRLDT